MQQEGESLKYSPQRTPSVSSAPVKGILETHDDDDDEEEEEGIPTRVDHAVAPNARTLYIRKYMRQYAPMRINAHKKKVAQGQL